MKIKRKINSKFLIAIFLIILIILFFIYGNIISRKLKIKKFEKENVRAYEKNHTGTRFHWSVDWWYFYTHF